MRISRWMTLAALAAILGPAAAARAQVGAYAMFSAGHYSGLGVGSGTPANQSGGLTALGGTFGLYDDVVHLGPVHLGADARLVVENSANSTPFGNKLLGGLVGARLDANTLLFPFRPYVQAEIGGVGTNNGTSYNRAAAFAYQVQFGGDFTLVPHVGLRLEYGAGQVETDVMHHTLQTFSAGVVLRL